MSNNLNMKNGIVLVNLGTPDSPSVKDVRRFLREFLMDPLVVDVAFLIRWILVHFIIAPFRGPKSAKEYQMLWTEQGSPLKFHSMALAQKLSVLLEGQFNIEMVMRYQNPDIRSGLEKLKAAGVEQLLIVPLFPQYAEATTLSIFNKVDLELEKMRWQPDIKKITSFAINTHFIDALTSGLNDEDISATDHIIFSYHGLPERQLTKLDQQCLTSGCCDSLNAKNKLCYKAQCYATSRAVAEKMQIPEDKYTVCFQSRQGNIPWIQPYVDDVIKQQATEGAKHLMVLSPAFVADCLETIIEIGHTYRNLFKDLGGETLVLVPSLNDTDEWVNALHNIILEHD